MNNGVLSLDLVHKWFSNICSALNHAHSRGIIHRDIKPSNLIVTNDLESCYLVDFGIALNAADLSRLTNDKPPGTSGYMSPEQERGEKLTPASDIFSLGVVLYECLAGFRPTVGQYTPLNSINEAIPSTIDTLIKQCLQERASLRIQSAMEFIDHLKNALRPKSSFSFTLAQGSLADINLSLMQMSPDEFNNLPSGQRTLIVLRLKDMIRVDDKKMRNPIASLLSQMVKLAYLSDERDYEFIIRNALEFGYEIEYSEQWKGNIPIRSALNNVALTCHATAHRIISNLVIEFWNDIDRVKAKESWYNHDLRIFFRIF